MAGSTERGVRRAEGVRELGAPAVLWIENDAAVLSYATAFLPTQGFRVEIAFDGPTGLALAGRRVHDVIVLDLRLPGLSGIEVLTELRQDRVGTPVMVLTGYPDTASALQAGRLGVEAYHSKPLIGAALIAALRQAVRASARTSALFGPVQAQASRSFGALLSDLDEVWPVLVAADSPVGLREPTRERLSTALALAACDPGLTFIEFLSVARALRAIAMADRALPLLAHQVRAAIVDAAARRQSAVDDRARYVLTRLESTANRWATIGAEDLAAELKLDSATLWEVLQDQLGLSFIPCRRAVVVRRAVLALAASDEQVAQIAYQIGYEHPNQLDRDVRRLLGVTPTQYRRLLSINRASQ